MSTNPTTGKAKLRPGRRSIRGVSESPAENALRRSSSAHSDDTEDYEIALVPPPTQIGSPSTSSSLPLQPNGSSGSLSTVTVRRSGSVTDGNPERRTSVASEGYPSERLSDAGPPPFPKLSAAPKAPSSSALLQSPSDPSSPLLSHSPRSASKYSTLRDLPRNWSDDESSLTEDLTPKSKEDSTVSPSRHRRHSSSKSPNISEKSNDKLSSISEAGEAEQKHSRARRNKHSNSKSDSYYQVSAIAKEKIEKGWASILEWLNGYLESFKESSVSRFRSVSFQSLDSLKDGIIFLLLLYGCDPTLINYEEFDMSDPNRALEAVFSIAEDYFGIPNVLDFRNLDQPGSLRSLVLYIAMFKNVIEVRNNQQNPLSVAKTCIDDMKLFVNKKMAVIDLLNDQLENETLRLAALSTKGELEEERKYLKERAYAMDKMVEMNKKLNSELETQNNALKEQIKLLHDKVGTLEKALQQEQSEHKKILERIEMEEKIKAMTELLEETDIDSFLEKHKDEIERVAKEMATEDAEKEAARKAKEAEEDALFMQQLHQSKSGTAPKA